MQKKQYLVHYDEDFLEHYGVLGMKWGHRKEKTSSKKKRSSVKDMTTKDLEKKVHRYRLEEQYKGYTSPKRQKAMATTQKILLASAGAGAGFLVKQGISSGIKIVRKYLASSAGKKSAEYIWDLM